jgi:chloride channel 7
MCRRSWGVTIIIAVLTAVLGAFVTFGILTLLRIKMNSVQSVVVLDQTGEAFALLLLWNMVFTAAATIICFWIPPASGSGIPEIKCVLNGLNIPTHTRMRTLLAKVIALIFQV